MASSLSWLPSQQTVERGLYGDTAGGLFQRGRVGDDGGDLFFTMPGQSDGAPEGEHIRVRLLGTVPSLQWDGDGALPHCLFMEVMRKLLRWEGQELLGVMGKGSCGTGLSELLPSTAYLASTFLKLELKFLP